ncbi:MAG TPA: RNA-binding domain-containing protein [Herpetosiphonaceae bacterium]|nr:RNA-binding domain-containing protein [Herpetosiphonaceae bacterium]
MTDDATFLDVLVYALDRATNYNMQTAIAPAAVLWPDRERVWEPLIPRLRKRLPVLTLGAYAPERGAGPPAWLRCMVARSLPESPPADVVPIVYLPGVGAEELDAAARGSRDLEMLVDLRYRSVVWVGPDGRDRDVAAFFQDAADGAGVAMRDDDFTRRAMMRVLPALCDITVAKLREDAPWRARDFERLVEESIRSLIRLGESAELEFKATARWDVEQSKKNTLMEAIILKTVAAFLNSARGGILLIGVDDDGSIRGISDDYPAFSKPQDQNRDGYERWLLSKILDTFGRDLSPYIRVTFHDVEGRDICKVAVAPGPRPVLVKEGHDDRLYVRTGNASNPLMLRDAISYSIKRWGTV